MRQIILDFAKTILDFESGSNYGQGPENPMNKPAPTGIANLADYIRRLLMAGKECAIAQREHDEGRVQWYREDVRKLRPLLLHSEVSADELFDLGYQSLHTERTRPELCDLLIFEARREAAATPNGKFAHDRGTDSWGYPRIGIYSGVCRVATIRVNHRREVEVHRDAKRIAGIAAIGD